MTTPGTLASITVSGLTPNDPAGAREIGPLTISTDQNVGETWAGVLSNGDNTIAVPPQAVAAIVIPPANASPTLLKIRTSFNTSDAGLPLYGYGLPFVYAWGPNAIPNSLIINSNSPVSAETTVVFI
jgi:hypothetical protein